MLLKLFIRKVNAKLFKATDINKKGILLRKEQKGKINNFNVIAGGKLLHTFTNISTIGNYNM
jgi:hypothetical protein